MNPFYQAMGGNRQPNMMQQFQQFMNQMRGKDPNAMIQIGRASCRERV